MDHFQLRNGVLHAEDVPLDRIAEAVGTPVYVYSRATFARHARVFREGLAGNPHLTLSSKTLTLWPDDQRAETAMEDRKRVGYF